MLRTQAVLDVGAPSRRSGEAERHSLAHSLTVLGQQAQTPARVWIGRTFALSGLDDGGDSAVPVVSIVLGEGTGGGALALMPADRTVCAENGWIAPLPPEGASAIVHRTGELAPQMAEAHRIRAVDLLEMGAVDEIVPELPDAAEEPRAFCDRVVVATARQLRELLAQPTDARLRARHERYRRMR